MISDKSHFCHKGFAKVKASGDDDILLTHNGVQSGSERIAYEGTRCVRNGQAQGDGLMTELDDAAESQGEPRPRCDEHGQDAR